MRQRINQTAIMGSRQSGLMLLAVLAVFFIVILAAAPASLQAASKITEISLSDQNKLTPTSAEIKGAAKIIGAEKGQKITADLLYGPDNLKALTITKDVPGSGEIDFTFAFSKPANGWPQGNYKVVISTSDGATKEMPFQVK